MDKAVITAPKEKDVKPPPKASSATIAKPKPGVVRSGGGAKQDAVKKPVAPLKKTTSVPASNAMMDDPYADDEKFSSAGGTKSSATTNQRGGGSAPPKVGGTAAAGKKVLPSVSNKPKVVEEPLGSNLPVNNLKAQRLSDEMRLKILKWNFTAPREEFIDLLKELMTAAGIGQTLMGNMFHSNFKLHLKALDTLQEVSEFWTQYFVQLLFL